MESQREAAGAMRNPLNLLFKLLFWPSRRRDEARSATRKALVAAVHSQVKPRIRALGFESAQTRTWRNSDFKQWLVGWGWIRIRGERVDLLSIDWEKYGSPRFQIVFSSQAREDWEARRWGDAYNFGSVSAGNGRGVWGRWFGHKQEVEEATALANERLAELDAYLKHGAPSPFVEDDAAL